MPDISPELINAMNTLRESVSQVGSTAANYVNIDLPSQRLLDKKQLQQSKELGKALGGLTTAINRMNAGMSHSQGGRSNVGGASIQNATQANQVSAGLTGLVKQLNLTVWNFSGKINPALSRIARQLNGLNFGAGGGSGGQPPNNLGGGAGQGGTPQQQQAAAMQQAMTSQLTGLVKDLLIFKGGVNALNAINQSLASGIDLQVTENWRMLIGVKEWNEIVAKNKIGMRAASGGLSEFTKTVEEAQIKYRSKLFGNDYKLAAESEAKLYSIVRQQSGIWLSQKEMGKQMDAFNQIFEDGMRFEPAPEQLRQLDVLTQSTEIQEQLMRVEETRRLGVVQEIMKQRQLIMQLGLVGEKANEFVKIIAKGSGTTGKERIVGGARAAQAAGFMGLDGKIQNSLRSIVMRGAATTKNDMQTMEIVAKRRMEIEQNIVNLQKLSDAAPEESQERSGYEQQIATAAFYRDQINDIMKDVPQTYKDQLNLVTQAIMKKGSVDPNDIVGANKARVTDPTDAGIDKYGKQIGSTVVEAVKTFDKFTLGNGALVALNTVQLFANYRALQRNTAALNRAGLMGPHLPGGPNSGGKYGKVGKYGKLLGKAGSALAVGFGVYQGYEGYKEADEKLHSGKITEHEADKEKGGAIGGGAGMAAGSIAGGWAGMQLGAATGALIGSFVGPLGTLVGAAIGGTVGGLGLGFVGANIGEKAGEKAGKAIGGAFGSKETIDVLNERMSKVEFGEKEQIVFYQQQIARATKLRDEINALQPKLVEAEKSNNEQQIATYRLQLDQLRQLYGGLKDAPPPPSIIVNQVKGMESKVPPITIKQPDAAPPKVDQKDVLKTIPGVSPYFGMGEMFLKTSPTATPTQEQIHQAMSSIPGVAPYFGMGAAFLQTPTSTNMSPQQLEEAMKIIPGLDKALALGKYFTTKTVNVAKDPDQILSTMFPEIGSIKTINDLIKAQQLPIIQPPSIGPVPRPLEPAAPVQPIASVETMTDTLTTPEQMSVKDKANIKHQESMIGILASLLETNSKTNDILMALVRSYTDKESGKATDSKLMALSQDTLRNPTGLRFK